MTTHEAILKALNTRWMQGYQAQAYILRYKIHISESSTTRRIRELRQKGHPITKRYSKDRNGRAVYEYAICE